MQRKLYYIRVLPRERGRSIILSKDRRVRQRWRRSRRGRRVSERSRTGSEVLRGGDSEQTESSLIIVILGKRVSQESNL
jgi:hypothetical protein